MASLIQDSLRIRADLLGFIKHMVRTYGDASQFRLGFTRVFIFNHPDHFEHVLKKNYKNYPKSDRYHIFRPTVGRGLLLAEGEAWTRRRRIVQPAFHHQKLSQFVPFMVASSEETVRAWSAYARANEPIRSQEEILVLVFKIASGTLFGASLPPADALAFHQSFSAVMVELEKRALSLFPWLSILPTPRNRRFKRHVAELDRIVYAIIEARKGSDEDCKDLLSMLMSAKRADGQPELGPRELRDEVMSLLIGGYETSTNVLVWALHLLSTHPEIQERLIREIEGGLGDTGEITLEKVKSLELLNAVILETMRMYPPVWLTTRQAVEDDVIGGHPVPKGSMVALSFYALHHRAETWPDPDRFQPERFMAPRLESIPRFAFLPFSAGARECVGRNLAMMDIPLILAAVLRKYRVSPVPGPAPRPASSLTFRPTEEIRLSLREV